MEIYKIIAVGIISAILIVYLKSINSELTPLAIVGSGLILLVMTASYVSEFVSSFSTLFSVSGVDKSSFYLTVKIIAVAYLIEFSATLIDDFGLKSVSDKVVFAGRILLLTMSLPIITKLIEVVVDML